MINESCSFSVTINTVATKSDSDVHLIRKSIDDQKSDHSLEKKSFLSPEHAKKSRKTSGSNTPETAKDKPLSNTPSATSTSNKSDHSKSPTNNKYLDKETRFSIEIERIPVDLCLMIFLVKFKMLHCRCHIDHHQIVLNYRSSSKDQNV